ncbi:MAG TPA: M18 family aminopeptidase [Sulfuricurvum sp.]|nr:M18 family aminopeptidase [Sulfuricurvum sp.]
MTKEEFNEGLLGFLDASPTPFHAVENMAGMLDNAGFVYLDERSDWALERGQRYYTVRNNSSLIAFTYPGSDDYVMLGAHTDSPNLKLKPSPVLKGSGTVRLGVEPYGGLLMNPWFDRDLGIAGRVAYRSSSGEIVEVNVDSRAPVAIIPSLAIHLDREANKSRSVNPQTDLPALIGCDEAFDFENWIASLLQKEGVEDYERLLSHELSLYDTQNAAYVGVEKEFIASARLDNLLSCYVTLLAMVSVSPAHPYLMICSDHEEVGSESSSGAAGPFLENTLRRIAEDYEPFVQLCQRSMMVSCDNAHAQHPNYAGKHDPEHAPYINKGLVLKLNANQRYASNSRTVSRFVLAAERAGHPLQEFVTRSDMGCGSTIGPITATRLGIETLDVGLPTYAMHSIRELAGSRDALELYEILLAL